LFVKVSVSTKIRMSVGSFDQYSKRPTFVVTPSGGQKTQQTRELLSIDVHDLGELVDMDALRVVHEDIGDVLAESNTDTSVVVYIRELWVIIHRIGRMGKGQPWLTLIAVCEGGARVVQSWAHAPSSVRMTLFSAIVSIALSLSKG
jgi:hypothetical protein